MAPEDQSEESKKITEYIHNAMLDFFGKRVSPSAKQRVEALESELSLFYWGDDEERLDKIASDFANEYQRLELSLFEEFNKEVFDCVFRGESTVRTEYSEFLKEKIHNFFDNTAAEPLLRIVEHAKKPKAKN